MRDPDERTASLALASGGPNPLRRAVAWYRDHDRLRSGDEVTMAADALADYRADTAAGKDALLIPDRWELCDALNKQIHHDRVAPDAPTVTGARGHRIGVGDIVVTRENTTDIDVWAAPDDRGHVDTTTTASQVRNGQRWLVERIDTHDERPRIMARRTTDDAVAVLSGDYLRQHVHHGYAVTLQSAQGVTADTSYPIVSDRTDRNTLYMGMTRGREVNRAFIYDKIAGEGDHEHANPVPGVHQARRGDPQETVDLVRAITGRENRPQTVHQVAANTDREQLPERVARFTTKHDHDLAARRAAYRTWTDHQASDLAEQNRWLHDYLDRTRAQAHTHERSSDTGYDIGL